VASFSVALDTKFIVDINNKTTKNRRYGSILALKFISWFEYPISYEATMKIAPFYRYVSAIVDNRMLLRERTKKRVL
jgi:hypothetical protein